MQDFIVPGTNGMSRFWRLNASGVDEIGGNTLSVSNTTYKKTPRGYQTYCATANGSNSSLTSGTTVSGVRTLFFSIYPTSNNRTFLTATGITITINSSSQIATSGLTGVSVSVNGQPTTAIVLDAWNFVAVTHDSANYASVNIFASSFIGDAQEVGTFDRVISETEIRNWYLESLRSLGGSTLSGLMDGVVAYYDFRGDANDIVGGYDGTVNGATLTTDRFGNANSAYSFTGGNNIYVGNGTLINNGSNTVSLWVRMDSLSHAILVVRGGYSVDWGFEIGYRSTTGFSFGTHTTPTDNSIISNFHPNVGEWNHVCAVFNSSSGSMQLYINGTSYGSISCGTTLRSNGTIGWTLGNGNSPASYPIIGGLSDVEIRFTPITANQVKSLYELSRQSKLLPFE